MEQTVRIPLKGLFVKSTVVRNRSTIFEFFLYVLSDTPLKGSCNECVLVHKESISAGEHMSRNLVFPFIQQACIFFIFHREVFYSVEKLYPPFRH